METKTKERTLGAEYRYRDMFRRRLEEIPGPIRELGMENPLIHQIIDQYAVGSIITKEEALCQMIVGLSKNWSELSKKHFEILMLSPR
jgi:hypothetical protein